MGAGSREQGAGSREQGAGSLKFYLKKIILKSKILKKFYFFYRQYFLKKSLKRYKHLDRRAVFTNIYKNSEWGGDGSVYYSGVGSHRDFYVVPYCAMLKNFIKKHNIKSVVDLGCGDFSVASRWLDDSIDYTGIDIVEDMIKSHERTYGSDHVHFLCRDIVEDKLPEGDVCLIRQVLQHLSNADVFKVLANTKKYPYVLITESRTIKEKALFYNIDIITSSAIRAEALSGLYFDEAPFNLEVETLLQIPEPFWQGIELTTVLVKNKGIIN